MKENIIKTIIILLIMIISIHFINYIYKKFFKHKKQIHIQFSKNFMNSLIFVIGFYFIFLQFDVFKNFSTAILTSSSLLVVVLGFAFQTSLEDFIAGILISIFKPFNIDDRITLINQNISGYIENITIRHTVIRTFQNSRLIIPNSIMNKEVLENNDMTDCKSSNFIDVIIPFDSNLELAKKIIETVIINHPKVLDTRTEEEKTNNKKQIVVYFREFHEKGIYLRANVWTNTVDENFLVCSEIRETIYETFKKNQIHFAYPHLHLEPESKKSKIVY